MLGGGDHGEPHDRQTASNFSDRRVSAFMSASTLQIEHFDSGVDSNLAHSKIGNSHGSRTILISVPSSMKYREACFAFVEICKIKVVRTIEINTPGLVIPAFQSLKVSERRNLCSV